jgi:phosphoesterase RecJ-like protein
MTTNTIQWGEATQAIESAKSILIVTHISPDGDAIGSLIGLTIALREKGKQVVPADDDPAPEFLQFIPGTDTIVTQLTEGEWDLMISVDSSDEKRTGVVGEYGRAHSQKVINLDHHTTNTYFGDIFLVNPAAVAASEVISDWLRWMGHPISREVAVALLTGLVTDTLGFRTSNVSAGTLGIAQQLMQAGASLTEVTARTLDSKSYNAINLWKQTLPTVSLEGKVISATITQADLQRAGITETTDGGLVGLLNSVNEAMIAVVFKETPQGTVELSLRSKPGYDVSRVAFALGGGGHMQASGATIPGPLEEARKRVVPMLLEAAKNGKLNIV